MKTRGKLTIAAAILAVSLGTFYFNDPVDPPADTRENERISVFSHTLDYSNVRAFPALQNDSSVWIWSVHNDEILSFYIRKSDESIFELMISDLDRPEVFYQVQVMPSDNEANFYKYVGGIWNVDGNGLVRREPLTRVLWEQVNLIDISEDGVTIRIDIPWEAIPGITITDRIGIQIAEGEGESRAWDSLDPQTSILDRRSWNQLNLN
jgi:hypothetical protein